jgi:hypothetical protein
MMVKIVVSILTFHVDVFHKLIGAKYRNQPIAKLILQPPVSYTRNISLSLYVKGIY